jgi:hypothetical protein
MKLLLWSRPIQAATRTASLSYLNAKMAKHEAYLMRPCPSRTPSAISFNHEREAALYHESTSD